MNRHWISIMKTKDLFHMDVGETDDGVTKLWEAESNSPNNKIRLSGDPEVLEAVKILLNALPPTYTKNNAQYLMTRAVDEVFE